MTLKFMPVRCQNLDTDRFLYIKMKEELMPISILRQRTFFLVITIIITILQHMAGMLNIILTRTDNTVHIT